jgi:hypothetical protein
MSLHCLSLHQQRRAITLGNAFAKSFAINSANVGKGEIVLFRAMEKSLKAVANSPGVLVEEYHGSSYQVTFLGTGTYSRINACCELSDLLIVIYDRQTKDARLTYVQAKSERDVVANPIGVGGSALKANLEQWDLLARRPQIAAAPRVRRNPKPFNPPPDLLSSAQLASIASFAFFLHGAAGVDIYYSAASALAMPFPYRTRSGKLSAVGDLCSCVPMPECLSAYGNAEFGAFLFGIMIGTPILLSGTATHPRVCSWLASQFRGLAAQAAAIDRRADLAN